MLSPDMIAALGQNAGIVLIVFLFLKYLKHQEEKMGKLIDRNIDALERNTEALGEIGEVLRAGK